LVDWPITGSSTILVVCFYTLQHSLKNFNKEEI
jgi:hypothetical protein